MINIIALILVVSAGLILMFRWLMSGVKLETAEIVRRWGAEFGVNQDAGESDSAYKERVLRKVANPLDK